MESREARWQLIEDARARVVGAAAPGAAGSGPGLGPGVAAEVAGVATRLLAARGAGEIIEAQRALWAPLAESYRSPLWAAAYLINGGCSDDGFDYFRGWLVLQGRAVFERVVVEPDELAGLPAVVAAVRARQELDAEEALGIAWRAHLAATGRELPPGSFSSGYSPERTTASTWFTPQARTRTRTSPGSSPGRSTSTASSTSGPPNAFCLTARISMCPTPVAW